MQSHANLLFQPKPSQPYQEVIVKTNGANLYCKIMGKGEPLIVVHGGPGLSMDYLLPGLEPLAKDHLVIFYDQRGNGQSTGDINKQTMNLEQFVNDLSAIQRHFNLLKTSLLGHSFGAYLALKYATEYPNLINKLIILNSIPLASTKDNTTEKNKQDPYEAMIASIIHSKAFAENDAQAMIKCFKI